MIPREEKTIKALMLYSLFIVLLVYFIFALVVIPQRGNATLDDILEVDKHLFREPIIIEVTNFEEEFEKELPEFVPPVVEIKEVAVAPKVEKVKVQKKKEPIVTDAIIDSYVNDICSMYPTIAPSLVKSVIWHESRYNPNATGTSGDLGLMQVITKWHKPRMAKLGVSNLYDPYGNILVGVDYLAEIQKSTNDISLTLMTYNMGSKKAKSLHSQGTISKYALSVIERAGEL